MHPQIVNCAIGVLICAGVATYVATSREPGPARRLIMAFMGAMILWCLGLGLGRLQLETVGRNLSFPIHFAGAIAMPPLWLLIASRLTRFRLVEGLSKRTLALAFGLPTATIYALALTNRFHQLIFTDSGFELDVAIAGTARGLLLVPILWWMLMLTIGCALYLRQSVGMFVRREYLRSTSLGCAAFAPLPVATAAHVGLVPVGSGLVQLVSALSVATLFGLSWRYRIRELLPRARRDVIEQLFDGVIIVSESGIVLDVNLSAASISGTTSERLRGRPAVDVFAEMSRSSDHIQFNRAVSSVASTEGPWRHSFMDRRGRLLETTTSTLRDSEGDLVGYFVVLRDQTERRRLERLLHQSQRLETVSELAAGIAHEVNNPLAFVRSNLTHISRLTGDLEEGPKPNTPAEIDLEEIREVVDESLQGVDRISTIIDRIHEFSKVDDDRQKRVDLNQAVHEALRLAKLHRNDAVGLVARLDPKLPRIHGSNELLTQALLNVLLYVMQSANNTRDAMVTIETQVLDGLVEVRIEDNGPEIPVDSRDRLFDPFSANDVPKGGPGLGLAIAFGIVRGHRGVLELESSSASGSCYRLRIPMT